jgi:SET domain-containing protein
MSGYGESYGTVIVNNSRINKYGVFAAKDFKKSEIVIAWKNIRKINEAEYNALPPEERNYIEILDDGTYLLVGKPERYVNYSCNPNTAPDVNGNDAARRDIKSGEEITTDYKDFSIPEGRFICKCGTPQCREIIIGRPSIPGT